MEVLGGNGLPVFEAPLGGFRASNQRLPVVEGVP